MQSTTWQSYYGPKDSDSLFHRSSSSMSAGVGCYDRIRSSRREPKQLNGDSRSFRIVSSRKRRDFFGGVRPGEGPSQLVISSKTAGMSSKDVPAARAAWIDVS